MLDAGLPKLNDANNAGTKHSEDCTLILTEGDSAMSLAVAGLAVIGRDSYGVFPLRSERPLHTYTHTHTHIQKTLQFFLSVTLVNVKFLM